MEEKEVNLNEEKEERYCSNCGAVLKENVKFCSNCGMSTEKKEPEILICKKCNNHYEKGEKFCSNCGANLVIQNMDDMSDVTIEEIEENKTIGILCYFSILLLIPFLTRPNSKYIKFHSNQGIILIIAYVIISIILLIPILGWVVGIIGYILLLILNIIGIINVVKGRMKRLPIIGKYNIIK